MTDFTIPRQDGDVVITVDKVVISLSGDEEIFFKMKYTDRFGSDHSVPFVKTLSGSQADSLRTAIEGFILNKLQNKFGE